MTLPTLQTRAASASSSIVTRLLRHASRLKRDIESDLVTVLEAVRNGLGDAGHRDLHTIDADFHDAKDERLAREPCHAQRGVVQPW